MKKVGLVLSGGGARGFAHLGAIKALEEIEITPSILSGSSAGAIIAAFYSAGYEPEEIIEIALKGNFFSFSNIQLNKTGIFNMQSFDKIFKKYFKENLIESLPIPICIAATDIIKGKTHYFKKGNLSTALQATSCIPLVFNPININDSLYLDGGILNNLPIEPLKNKCEFIIGVHCNEMSFKNENFHMKDLIDRSFHMAMNKQVHDKMHLCNLFIAPPDMSKYGLFDVNKAEEIFLYAYHYTKDFLKLKKVFSLIEDIY